MRKSAVALALCLGVTLLSSSASATDLSSHPYGAVLGNYVAPDDDRNSDDGIGGTVIFFGQRLARHLNLEFSGFGNTLKRDADGGRDTQFGLGLDVMVPLTEGTVRPFLLLGAGGIREQLDNTADRISLNPYVNAGGGLLVALGDRFALRAEARWLADFNNGSYPGTDLLGDLRFGLGLQYAFGRPAPPLRPAVATVPAPADSDKDRVIDPNDKCPDTPAGVKVDATGCPLDSDGDGVPDYLDKCPTPKGFKVDAEGCLIEQAVILRGVNFEYERHTLTTEAKGVLDAILPGLAAQPSLTLEIAGHTDAKGTDAYNLVLSQRRAEAVKAYLVARGVAPERLTTVGYGESKPIADNATDAGRAENRRAEFVVLNKPPAVKVINK